MTDLLHVQGLSVSFAAHRERLTVLHDVSVHVGRREIVGLVGESGSGKSVTSLAIMGLLGLQGRIDRGRIEFDGRCISELQPADRLTVRGREIAMIFQEPSTCLNPVFRVGEQIAETCRRHFHLGRQEAMQRAVKMMERVGIPAADRRARQYPHELSGGLKQRVMIAMALVCKPKLLIADEPTTALDVTTQAQIIELILQLHADFDMAVLLITHDMGVVAEAAHRVVVMYAGQVVEEAPARLLFANPRHPYTRLLLRSIPSAHQKQTELPIIDGTMPAPAARLTGCRFASRCPMASDACRARPPALQACPDERRVRCVREHAIDAEMPMGSGVGHA